MSAHERPSAQRRLRLIATLAAAVLALTACYGDTESAENVTSTSATLMAWGVPQTSSTDVYFEYGTTNPPTQRTAVAHPDNLTKDKVYPIPWNVSGLTPNTRYYYRMCGKERSETAYRCGNIKSFITTTFANPAQFRSANGTVDRYLHADPKIVYDGGVFYGTGTGCTLTTSAGGTVWTKLAEICGNADGMHSPGMDVTRSGCNFCATEVAKVGSRWVMVTTGARRYPERGANYTRSAIFIATANNPQGPYTWTADAIVKDIDSGFIDPSIFVDPKPGGKTWVTWTRYRDYGTPGAWTGTELMAQQLDPADITRVLLGSAPVELLSSEVQPQPREKQNAAGRGKIEGQGVFVYAGKYYLHYAAGTFVYNYQAQQGAQYNFNITEGSDTFPGRFTKRPTASLSGGNGWRAPGHGSVFADSGGNLWSSNSPYKDPEPICESPDPDVRAWCHITRTVVLQKLTFDHSAKVFTIYDGVVNPGQIGVPTP